MGDEEGEREEKMAEKARHFTHEIHHILLQINIVCNSVLVFNPSGPKIAFWV